jgi:intracellular septation protein|tara:strand:- start:1342 stop:1992 length:651 start_codon:yes stop_codon:yes gene_type:complete
MKQLFDFLPIVLFFVIYKFFLDLPDELLLGVNSLLPFMALTPGNHSDAIYLATLVAILATIIQVGISATILKKVEKMPLITLGLLVVFGGATLLLKDPLFIQWKPTAINWLFGLGFLLSQFIGKKPLVQRMMSQAISIDDDRVWLKLNLSWVLFFALSGLANLLVAPAIDPLGFGFTESTWVDFKLFGLMGMTIAFVIAQAFYLSRFMNTTAEGHD